MEFKFSLCTAPDSMQKKLYIDDKTGELIKEPPPFFPSRFKSSTRHTDLEGLCAILKRIKPEQFLIHGYTRDENATVVTKELKEDKYKDDNDIVTRSPGYFKYDEGKPGLFMIDVDEEGYEVEDILSMLTDIYPPFKDAGYVSMPSSSSNIRTPHRKISGTRWHLYFVAQQGHDLERFAKTLFERSVLGGYGHVFISRDGRQHVRSFFDVTVISPFRIDFVAPPVTQEPLYRDKVEPIYNPGGALDTFSLNELTRVEQQRLHQVQAELRHNTKKEAAEVRAKYLDKQVDAFVEKTGYDRQTARAVIEARYVDEDEVRLHFDDLIEFEDGDRETVFVRDIITKPGDFVGRSVKDPVEPEYGEGKAKIYLSSGRLLINSFVHGGRKFILSGRITREFDTDDNARLLGFRLDSESINGAWAEQMLSNWVKIRDGGKVKYVHLMKEANRFVPIPEKGEAVSGLFSFDPLVMFDEKNFLQAMPNVHVITGWDVKEKRPKEEPLGPSFIRLPNVGFKSGGITMTEPSPEIDKIFINRWLGFPVTPKKGKVHKVIDQYFEEFIEYESEATYEYFWSYIYHMFQHPFEKPGVAILMQSPQGTGKGTFIQCISSLIGPVHSAFVDKIDSIVGKFNGIIAGKILVYADEVMFGGFHQANNVLKKIITDEYLTIEEKYQAPQRIANVSRLFFSTNEGWALSIDRDDRRLFVPRISTTFRKDTEFFTELRYQWNRNPEAIMHRFLTMPITADVSKPPMTREKAELIDISMGSVEAFFKEILTDGFMESHGVDFIEDITPFQLGEPTEIVADVLYAVYRSFHHRFYMRQGEASNKNVFWKEAYNLFGGKDRSGILNKGRIGTSKRKVVFPPLSRLRVLWDEAHSSSDFDTSSNQDSYSL